MVGLLFRDAFAPRSGVSCGVIGLRKRTRRLWAGAEYIYLAHSRLTAFLACDASRPRLSRTRSRVLPQSGLLAAPFLGAEQCR